MDILEEGNHEVPGGSAHFINFERDIIVGTTLTAPESEWINVLMK